MTSSPVALDVKALDIGDLLERLEAGCRRTGEGENGEELYDVDGATDDMWEAAEFIRSALSAPVDDAELLEAAERAVERMLAAPVAAAPVGVKQIATKFFRWWWNQPGANTDEGFDEWAKAEGAPLLAALIAPAKPAVELVEALLSGDLVGHIVDSAIIKCRALHDYAGRPAWEVSVEAAIRETIAAKLAALQAPAIPDAQTEVEK